MVKQRSELANLVQSSLEARLSKGVADQSVTASEGNFVSESTPQFGRQHAFAAASAATSQSTEVAIADRQMPALYTEALDTKAIGVRLEHGWQRIPQVVRLGLIVLGMILLFLVFALLLRPVRLSLFS